MNWFNLLITAFCAAEICFGAFLIISPDGKIKKSVKYVLSLCFLLIIVSIAGINVDLDEFEMDFVNTKSIDTEMSDNATLEYVIAIALQKADITFSEISVYTDNSSQDSISCTEIKIKADCDEEKIISALGGENKNLKVEVINE